MKITKSIIVESLPQRLGRDVRERHVWEDKTETDVYYRAGPKVDVQKTMLARVPVLEAQRAAREAEEAERAALESKQRDAIKRLALADVADVLMVSETEAAALKVSADRKGVR